MHRNSGKKRIYVEMADNHIKRQIGLQRRKSMGMNEGMLFRFPSAYNLAFWMKDTYIPLDIAFIADDGKILQISSMYPLSTRQVKSESPCRFALEVNRGWFKENDINIGDKFVGYGIDFKSAKKSLKAQTSLPVQNGNNGTGLGASESVGREQTSPQSPISRDVEINMSKEQMIEYAGKSTNKGMTIVYVPDSAPNITQVKHILPTDDGYIIEEGKSGKILKAFDDSPTVSGTGWESKGKQIKSFLIDNIIAMELDEEKIQKVKI